MPLPFHQVLRRYRRQRDLTQKDLAEALKVEPWQVRRWERRVGKGTSGGEQGRVFKRLKALEIPSFQEEVLMAFEDGVYTASQVALGLDMNPLSAGRRLLALSKEEAPVVARGKVEGDGIRRWVVKRVGFG